MNADQATGARRTAAHESRPGSGLISAAALLLVLLAAGLFYVSLAAQYSYLDHVKHQRAAALLEAVALDVAMAVFSLLALGLARAGQPARAERLLIMVCAAGSAAMNYAAADVTSPRSVAAYITPPVFLAVVVDRVIAVVRRHVLGQSEQSAWSAAGAAGMAALRILGMVALYGLRLVLAPPSTAAGVRRAVLAAAPVPAGPVPVTAPSAAGTIVLAGPAEPAPQDGTPQAGDRTGDHPGGDEPPAGLPHVPGDQRPAQALAFPAGPHGEPEGAARSGAGGDAGLIAAGIRIREQAERDGVVLSRKAFAGQVREHGYTIANGRLSWLRAACGFPPADA